MNPAYVRCMNPSLVLTTSVISFGGLQGVKLSCVVVVLSFLDMGSQIAGARKPFQLGFRVAIAIDTCGVLYRAIAPLAFFDYRMTLSSVVVTPILPHEDALRP